MADRPHWIAEVADELLAELEQTAEAVAETLAPPADAADGREVRRAEFIAWWRDASYADPTFVQRDLDQAAPASIQLPDGTMLRAKAGLKEWLELVKEARPDLIAVVALAEGGP